MRPMTRSPIAMSVGAIVLLLCTAVFAQQRPTDKRTIFNFSGPVSVPGVTLQAGSYLFRLADTGTGRRSVVQVLSGDGKQALAQFFVMRAMRPEAAENPEVRFIETGPGTPTAISTWWYPSDRTGYEFVYPKEQARRLAPGSQDPILTTEAETKTTEETALGELIRISGSGAQTAVGEDGVTSEWGGKGHNGQIAPDTIEITPQR